MAINYYTTTTTGTANDWSFWREGSYNQNIQWNQPVTVTIQQPQQQVFVTDHTVFFNLLKEILKHSNPADENEAKYDPLSSYYDLQLLIDKLEAIVEMEKDLFTIGVSEQAMMKVAKCTTFKELHDFLKEPEEDDFEDEFGPFRLEDE